MSPSTFLTDFCGVSAISRLTSSMFSALLSDFGLPGLLCLLSSTEPVSWKRFTTLQTCNLLSLSSPVYRFCIIRITDIGERLSKYSWTISAAFYLDISILENKHSLMTSQTTSWRRYVSRKMKRINFGPYWNCWCITCQDTISGTNSFENYNGIKNFETPCTCTYVQLSFEIYIQSGMRSIYTCTPKLYASFLWNSSLKFRPLFHLFVV